jgi:uncharacterized protein (TIGR02246 family)
MRRAALVIPLLPLVALAACADGEVNLAAEEAAVRQADRAIVAAGNAHDIEALLDQIADDARMLPPNAPPVIGKDAIRELANALLSPDFEVRHDLDEVVVSNGGDLAYVSYAYELTFTGLEGTPVTETGKDISIYKKVADGSWKLAIDMWSSNEPAAIQGGES